MNQDNLEFKRAIHRSLNTVPVFTVTLQFIHLDNKKAHTEYSGAGLSHHSPNQTKDQLRGSKREALHFR